MVLQNVKFRPNAQLAACLCNLTAKKKKMLCSCFACQCVKSALYQEDVDAVNNKSSLREKRREREVTALLIGGSKGIPVAGQLLYCKKPPETRHWQAVFRSCCFFCLFATYLFKSALVSRMERKCRVSGWSVPLKGWRWAAEGWRKRKEKLYSVVMSSTSAVWPANAPMNYWSGFFLAAARASGMPVTTSDVAILPSHSSDFARLCRHMLEISGAEAWVQKGVRLCSKTWFCFSDTTDKVKS